jgi:predicted nuclease of predicted toxin-antitoxin system
VAERIRFHLDENVDPDIARSLLRYGIDVSTTVDVGLRTQDDVAHWAFVCEDGRVLMTHDADFLRFASRDNNHPGVAYCHKTAHSVGDIIRGFILIYEVLVPEEMVGRVEFL